MPGRKRGAEDEEEEEESEAEEEPQPPRQKRAKNQTKSGWEWNRAPLDIEGVQNDENMVASDKSLAFSNSVHSHFQQNLKKNEKARVSKNYTNFNFQALTLVIQSKLV